MVTVKVTCPTAGLSPVRLTYRDLNKCASDSKEQQIDSIYSYPYADILERRAHLFGDSESAARPYFAVFSEIQPKYVTFSSLMSADSQQIFSFS